MKLKMRRLISSAVFLAMTVMGIFGTNIVFAENEAEEINGEINLETVYPYQDTSLSFEERAADLVSRMTLEEKLTQLQSHAGKNGINRDGIKVDSYRYWKEGLHGIARQGKATSFPSSLSMSNTWDRQIVFDAADATGDEARGKLKDSTGPYGAGLSYWSPTINMARDPRWGRNEECYGEDPYLTSQYGIEFIDGMQGNRDGSKYLKTMATLKHFIANNCESERQTGTSVMDEQTLRDYYARAFQDIMEESDAASVMSSYNATTVTRNGQILWDYLCSPANPNILQDLLRRNWGFSGYVTGDCGAVANLNGREQFKRTLFPDTSVALKDIPSYKTLPFALRSGNDLDCGSAYTPAELLLAITAGDMTEDDIDIAVYNIFVTRMKTGEFDPEEDVPYTSLGVSELESDEHVAIAEKAAEKSWVLLKNEDNFLPIKNDKKKIVIVGNLAGEAYLGDYSGSPEKLVSPYQGLLDITGGTDKTVKYLGNVEDDAVLLNIKSVNIIDSSGKVSKVDMSAATAEGATLTDGCLTNVTKAAKVVIPNADFSKAAKIEVEYSAGEDSVGGTIQIGYGSATQTEASIEFKSTGSADEFTTASADYTGANGGYNTTADLYITIAVDSAFSVENYKADLDDADIIIAYAGTISTKDYSLKYDAHESKDREGIILPESQSHVGALTEAYPDKTAVVMQTVGQIDVSPFEKNAKAILWNSYNGQTQGTALAKVLFGEVNPSGKLTTTWYDPKDLDIMTIDGITQRDAEGIKWQRNDYSIRQRNEKPENFPEGFADEFPGRTYQYYKNTPIYPFGYGLSYTEFEYGAPSISVSSVDANGEFTVSVEVSNKGEVSGDEVVQLYLTSPGGDGINLPLKQLKGFERVSIDAGASKKVDINVNVKDLHFYSEETQEIYVPAGEWTVKVGTNSADAENHTAKINITGAIKNELKRVSVLPTGISLISTINPDGSFANAVKTIYPNLKGIMTTEKFIDDLSADGITVEYISSDEDIAVAEDGAIRANKKEGAALITAKVTVDGVTKEVSFPVVSTIKNEITSEQRAAFKKTLDDAYNALDSANYSEKNWKIIMDVYNETIKTIETEIDLDALSAAVDAAVNRMSGIKFKPADGLDIYELSNFTDTIFGEVEIDAVYNGDEEEPSGVLIAASVDENGNILKASQTQLNDSGHYKISGIYEGGDKLEIHVWDSFLSMVPFSKMYEHTFVEQEKPNFILYDFADEKFEGFYNTGQKGVSVGVADGMYGIGEFTTSKGTYELNYTKADGTTVSHTFTKGLQAGSGKETNRCVFFKPSPGYSSCKVTFVYKNDSGEGDDRPMYMCQYKNGVITDNGYLENGSRNQVAEVHAEGGQFGVGQFTFGAADTEKGTNMTDPILIWGGSSNKGLYGVIAEYFE